MKEKFLPAVRAGTGREGDWWKGETFLNVADDSLLVTEPSQRRDSSCSKRERNSEGNNSLRGWPPVSEQNAIAGAPGEKA